MCGISGIILRPGESASSDLSQLMARDMSHRGPDAQTFFTRENFSFSHRRLKIIDVSDAANQPVFNESGDVCVVFNGEIYNFEILKKLLQELGHKFKTNSDTEVIVHAFEEWGVDSFLKFNGMFAFAIWDGRSKKNEFYLVRDRIGIKPLFYTTNENRVGFASELKPLLRLPWVKKNISPETLLYYFKFSHVPNPASILEDVKQLEPGYFLHVSTTIKKQKYWDARSLFGLEVKFKKKDITDWEEEFEHILFDSVKRQQMSDVPIGCFLSGGIDSSLITMAFSAQNNKKIKTFSIGYKEADFDESAHAQEVSNIFQTEHSTLIVEPEDIQDLIASIPKYFDQPFADPSLLPTLILSKFAREKVTVALSGDGADEIFFGYDYQEILSHLGPAVVTPKFIRGPLFSALGATSGFFSERLRKFSEIMQFKTEAELFQYFIGTVGPMRMDRLKQVISTNINLYPSLYTPLMESARGLSWNEKIIYVFLKTFLVDTVLTKTDRASMAFGLEARVPFLDNEMLDFSARLPFDLKFSNGIKKRLLRNVLGKKVPNTLSQRKKQGFSIPLKDWLRGDLSYLIDEHIMSDKIKKDPALNAEFLRRLATEHMQGRRNHSHLLWSVICYQLWKDMYICA